VCGRARSLIDTALCVTFIIMAVQAESLDVLEKADLPPTQARAIVRAIELEIAGAKDTLATKHDLLSQTQDIHQQVATVRTEIATLRTDMADWRGELRAEIHASASSTTRQMYMALLGQMAVLLGFAYFFATHVR